MTEQNSNKQHIYLGAWLSVIPSVIYEKMNQNAVNVNSSLP